jgi:hypothetical protein
VSGRRRTHVCWRSCAARALGLAPEFSPPQYCGLAFPVADSGLRVRGGGRRAPARSHKVQACWHAAQRHANAQ